LGKITENNKKFLASLKNFNDANLPHPVYIITGDEDYIKERAIYRLNKYIKEKEGSFERINFDNVDINEWIDSLYDMPMFSNFRFIVASDIGKLDEYKREKLYSYIKNPSKDVILLILGKKIDKRKKYVSKILKESFYFEAKTPYLNELDFWATNFALEKGKILNFKAKQILIEKYQDSLLKLQKEIDKLSAYVGKKQEIIEEDVFFLSSGTFINVFDIFNFLAKKDKKQLLKHVYQLLFYGENPLKLFALVRFRIRKLLLAKDLKEKENFPDDKIRTSLGLHQFFYNDFKKELLAYTRDELINMYKKCIQIESKLKSINIDGTNYAVEGFLNLFNR
jgi:DNA polymerase III subunit delta